MTVQESFNDTEFWIESAKNQCAHNPLVILIGNKKDLKGMKIITKEMAMKRAIKYGIPHFEVSANDQQSIDDLLDFIKTSVLE